MSDWFHAVAAPLPRDRFDVVCEVMVGQRYCVAIDREFVENETKLAAELSRLAGDELVYLLVYTEDYTRSAAYRRGEQVGVVNAHPLSVLGALGCPLEPGRYDNVDLSPRSEPRAAPGERKIYRRTLAQWEHDIAYEDGWELALEGCDDPLPALAVLEERHPVGYHLVSALLYESLFPVLDRTVVALHAFAASSSEPELADDARELADELVIRHDDHLARGELPWLAQQFAQVPLDELLRLLVDDRLHIRRAVTTWVGSSSPAPAARAAIVATLEQRSEPDRIARVYLGYALSSLRR